MIVTVTVAARHIQRDSHMWDECPVALALREAIPGHRFGITGVPTSYVDLGDVRSGEILPVYHRPLPAEAIAWIRAFDGGRPVEPFSFELER